MEAAGSGFVFLAPEWTDEAPSTNDVLKARLASVPPPPSGTVFAARRQTRGKGRLGNAWRSAEAGDLTFSFVWRGSLPLGEAGALPLACGLAVRDFLAGLGIGAECKWPNDVFAGGAKICGILTEGGADAGGAGGLALVVGIGVNLRAHPERDCELGRPTASVERCLGRAPDPEAVLPALLRCLERRVAGWQAGGFAALRDDMNRALRGRGEAVGVRTPSGLVEGTVAGLGEKGELLVRSEDGRLIVVSSVAALEEVYSGSRTGNTI